MHDFAAESAASSERLPIPRAAADTDARPASSIAQGPPMAAMAESVAASERSHSASNAGHDSSSRLRRRFLSRVAHATA